MRPPQSEDERVVVVVVVALVCLALLALFFVVTGVSLADDPAPSCSPSAAPSATPAPEPASAATVRWATAWRRHARTVRGRLLRARVALGGPHPSPLAAAPSRSASEAEWLAAAGAWRGQRAVWRAKWRRALRRMTHPGGSGVDRWRPLALYVGWSRGCWPTLRRVMWDESRGCPWAVNPRSGCAGLLQIHPCHGVARPLDPAVNLRVGLRLYRESGWGPWGGQ